MCDISVIIPAYNEERVVGSAIDQTFAYFTKVGRSFEIIVVDDGSRDETQRIVKEKQKQYTNVKLLANEKNLGKGAAVKLGALRAEGDWLLFLDADLSTAPDEFEKFLPVMKNHDIVIGSRAVSGARITRHQPFFRELGGRFFNLVVRFYLGLPWRDTQCGFKCFSRKTKIIFEKQKLNGWIFDVELLWLAHKMSFTVAEVPIVWTDDPTSTVKFRDLFSILRDLRRVKKIRIDSKERHSVYNS